MKIQNLVHCLDCKIAELTRLVLNTETVKHAHYLKSRLLPKRKKLHNRLHFTRVRVMRSSIDRSLDRRLRGLSLNLAGAIKFGFVIGKHLRK